MWKWYCWPCSQIDKLFSVYRHELSIGTSCLQARAVYRPELTTGTSCLQAQVVYRPELSTGTSCLQARAVYRHELSTGPSCLQTRAAYRPELSTGTSCLQARAVYRHELPTTNIKSIFKFNLKEHLLNKYVNFCCENDIAGLAPKLKHFFFCLALTSRNI